MRIRQGVPVTLASPKFGALFFIVLALTLQQSLGISDQVEVRALEAIKRSVGDGFDRLSKWTGNDPCGANWTGVICTPINGVNHVTELRLLNMNFTGTLAPDLGNLTHLNVLDFMWNNITGPIPSEIGYLSSLELLLLNGNKLSGTLAPELGNLSNLTRFQIDINDISGHIPSSFQSLSKVKHFHMNNNSLNGSIPPELGQLQSIIHILFDNNDLSGELPSELSNISTLTILQLDNNHFNGPIPTSYSQMPNITKLSLRNCNLTGPVLNMSALTTLVYLDLSQNQLTGGLPTNLSQTLLTIDLSSNQLDGELPAEYYGLKSLELLILENNSLDGNVTGSLFAHNDFTGPNSVLILDFQNNNFTGFTSGALIQVSNVTLRLAGNPVCDNSSASSNHCTRFNGSITDVALPSTAMLSTATCPPSACDGSHNQELDYGLLALGTCKCAYPLTIYYRLKSPSFAVYPPYEKDFQSYLALSTELADSQINASVFTWEPGPRLSLIIKLFPGNSGEFSGSDVSRLYTQFTTWHVPDNRTFGPYEMLGFPILFPYNGSSSVVGSKSGLSSGAITGIVIAAALLTAVVVGAFMLVVVRHKYRNVKARRQTGRQYERIKVEGVRDFTYEDMAKATDNFDASRQIGQGGYGRVYKAVLEDGTEVAIKRAQEGSLQGQREFLTELELMSRVHHRNILSLVGFCDDEGEQMLVYEYMPSGTLRDNLNSGSKAPLNFATRLQLAIGSAKGILYLHTEADPPIFHRDIKASNILLDKKLRARVADFGLSKLAGAPALEEGGAGGYVSTVVKGTPGYLDPEYFLTHKLTDKSDVYSFGVVLLELITGQQPISMGKNLVREVNLAYQAGMVLSIVDPRMGHYPSECLQPFLRLAISCCRDDTDARPNMAEVVRELEGIWRLMPAQDSMTSFETSVESSAGNGKHQGTGYVSSSNPFVSGDIDGSNLASGYVPSIAPR